MVYSTLSGKAIHTKILGFNFGISVLHPTLTTLTHFFKPSRRHPELYMTKLHSGNQQCSCKRNFTVRFNFHGVSIKWSDTAPSRNCKEALWKKIARCRQRPQV